MQHTSQEASRRTPKRRVEDMPSTSSAQATDASQRKDSTRVQPSRAAKRSKQATHESAKQGHDGSLNMSASRQQQQQQQQQQLQQHQLGQHIAASSAPRDTSCEPPSIATKVAAAIEHLQDSVSKCQPEHIIAACSELADLAAQPSGSNTILLQADKVALPLLQCLSLTQPHTVMQQAAELLAGLTNPDLDGVDAIVKQPRIAHVLLGALACSGSNAVARPAALALSNLCELEVAMTAVFQQPGSVLCMLAGLESSDAVVAQHAASALADVAWWGRDIDCAICQQPAAVPALVAALAHANTLVVHHAASAIAWLSSKDSGKTAIMHHAAAAITALSTSLTHPSEAVQRFAAMAVARLAYSAPGDAAIVKDAATVGALLSYVASACTAAAGNSTVDKDEAVEWCMVALCNLAVTAGGPAVIWQANGLPILTSALKHNQQYVVISAAEALQSCSDVDHDGSIDSAMLAAGALEALLACLSHTDAEVVAAAAHAIATLMIGERGVQAMLRINGVASLVGCLRHSNGEVVEHAVKAVRYISDDYRGATALLKQAGVVSKLVACLKHDAPAAEHAKLALEQLAEHDSTAVPSMLSAVLEMAQEHQQLGSMRDAARNLQEAIINAAGQLSTRT